MGTFHKTLGLVLLISGALLMEGCKSMGPTALISETPDAVVTDSEPPVKKTPRVKKANKAEKTAKPEVSDKKDKRLSKKRSNKKVTDRKSKGPKRATASKKTSKRPNQPKIANKKRFLNSSELAAKKRKDERVEEIMQGLAASF